ncbi:flagellar biosynthesis protein FlhF [Paraglaciecola hydrolytica]|uniref:Flagellar biosynthesis protein FlhF n=1 Tax=Paraglaciecola hydrolytica TaxID=1799789 RepID=A0A148KNP5_9ALTE|nr:flagellar biosynthesis protein FlhF [Paraglaciecola hydrolytica]KXI27943.1 flagellar biosynthesis protein FlhF [Paraglaciecola hydrolytica]
MKIRRFYGKDMRDALKQVKDELGGDAVIMSNKKHADGVEIVAAYDKEPSASAKPKQAKFAGSTAPYQGQTPTLSEIIGDSGPDSLRALLEKQSKANTNAEPRAKIEPVIQEAKTETTLKAPKTTVTPVQQYEQKSALDDMRMELSSLRNILQFQIAGLLKQDKSRKHPLHAYLVSSLEQMGISTRLAEEVVAYAPDNADERQAWLFLLKLLANRLPIGHDDILVNGGVVALMGPTGTGKTTTIAKLAAQAAHKYGAEQVAIITLDNYRIAAFEQIATYGRIIGCNVKKAQSSEELADLLFQFRNKRLVLIDTAGFGQRDVRLIKQLDTLNGNVCANIKKFLVLQANCQYQVIQQSIKAYSPVALHGCILTKLDECYSLGEVISAAIEHKLPVCYLTNGQRVPEDLQVADTKFLISSAAKLYKKYGLIHTTENYPHNAAVAV